MSICYPNQTPTGGLLRAYGNTVGHNVYKPDEMFMSTWRLHRRGIQPYHPCTLTPAGLIACNNCKNTAPQSEVDFIPGGVRGVSTHRCRYGAVVQKRLC